MKTTIINPENERDQIAITWCVEDVKSIAPDLTHKQCQDVLQCVLYKHDATVGVNWDTLEYWADEIRNETVEVSNEK